VAIRASANSSSCPLCGAVAFRVRSHYVRRLGELPIADRRTDLKQARRFSATMAVAQVGFLQSGSTASWGLALDAQAVSMMSSMRSLSFVSTLRYNCYV
jgi:hypothetical protein